MMCFLTDSWEFSSKCLPRFWQMAKYLADSWEMAENLADSWNSSNPIANMKTETTIRQSSNANEGEQKIILICILFGSSEVRRLNWAVVCNAIQGWITQLVSLILQGHPT